MGSSNFYVSWNLLLDTGKSICRSHNTVVSSPLSKFKLAWIGAKTMWIHTCIQAFVCI